MHLTFKEYVEQENYKTIYFSVLQIFICFFVLDSFFNNPFFTLKTSTPNFSTCTPLIVKSLVIESKSTSSCVFFLLLKANPNAFSLS